MNWDEHLSLRMPFSNQGPVEIVDSLNAIFLQHFNSHVPVLEAEQNGLSVDIKMNIGLK